MINDILDQLQKDVNRAAHTAKAQAKLEADCLGLSANDAYKSFINNFETQFESCITRIEDIVRNKMDNKIYQLKIEQSFSRAYDENKIIDLEILDNDSPIFDEEGNFLGVDSEGYTGDVIIMNKEKYNELSKGGLQTIDHMDAYREGIHLDKANLNLYFEVKIETHIANQYRGKVGGNPLILNNKITILKGDETTISKDKVPSHYADGKFVYTNGSKHRQWESTVENIQTTTIAHEEWSHNRNNWGDNNGQHHKAYLNEIDFPLFPKTTRLYKTSIMVNLENYLKDEKINFDNLPQIYKEEILKYKGAFNEVIDLAPLIIKSPSRKSK